MNEMRLKILEGLIDLELYEMAKTFIDALQEEELKIQDMENRFLELLSQTPEESKT